MPAPKQPAVAPKAVATKKMPTAPSKSEAATSTKLEDVAMDDDATRKGEPSDAAGADDDEGDTTDAGEEEAFPLGSHPCAQCQAIVANGMLFCLRRKAPQTDDSAKATKLSFENVKVRQRILATAATGSNKPIEALLTSDLRNMGDGSKKRGPDERGGGNHSRCKRSQTESRQVELLIRGRTLRTCRSSTTCLTLSSLTRDDLRSNATYVLARTIPLTALSAPESLPRNWSSMPAAKRSPCVA